MGKPAATLGSIAETCNDPANLPVGQVIAVGTVLINNKPAAKQGDQVIGVDIHIIQIPSPAGPIPTPLPHPFNGIIDGNLSTSVKIMGMPAATVDSTASNMPPHIPQGGPFQKPPDNKATIKMGSFNVNIDNGGGGGGGGSGGGGSVQSQAAASSGEGHFLDLTFVDKGGKTITGVAYSIKAPNNEETNGVLTGPIKRSGLKEGSYEISLKAITKAEWSTKSAHVGDKIKLLVDTVGVEDGEKAVLQIFIKDSNCADRLHRSLDCQINGGKAEAEWELSIDDDFVEKQDAKVKSSGYSTPSFYFTVTVANLKTNSGLLILKDYVELELKDENDKPVGNVKYTVYLPNGGVKEGYLDKNGYAKIENLPPGKVEYKYDIRDRNA